MEGIKEPAGVPSGWIELGVRVKVCEKRGRLRRYGYGQRRTAGPSPSAGHVGGSRASAIRLGRLVLSNRCQQISVLGLIVRSSNL